MVISEAVAIRTKPPVIADGDGLTDPPFSAATESLLACDVTVSFNPTATLPPSVVLSVAPPLALTFIAPSSLPDGSRNDRFCEELAVNRSDPPPRTSSARERNVSRPTTLEKLAGVVTTMLSDDPGPVVKLIPPRDSKA